MLSNNFQNLYTNIGPLEDRVASVSKYNEISNLFSPLLPPAYQGTLINKQIHRLIYNKSLKDKYARVLRAILGVDSDLTPSSYEFLSATVNRQYEVLRVFQDLRPREYFEHIQSAYLGFLRR